MEAEVETEAAVVAEAEAEVEAQKDSCPRVSVRRLVRTHEFSSSSMQQ